VPLLSVGWKEDLKMIPETGPYLKAAVLCENVIEGKDGVLSLIRVIDRVTLTAAGPQAPEEMPPVQRELKLVLMFISGRARGTHSAELKVEKPDGDIRGGWSGSVFLEGEDRGANLVIQINFTFELQGLYWFHLFVDDSLMTKLPFRLIYQRVGPRTALQSQ
jgi:hypothetical protein